MSGQRGLDFLQSLPFTHEQSSRRFSAQRRQHRISRASGWDQAYSFTADITCCNVKRHQVVNPAEDLLLFSHIYSVGHCQEFSHLSSQIKPLWRKSGDYPECSACLKAAVVSQTGGDPGVNCVEQNSIFMMSDMKTIKQGGCLKASEYCLLASTLELTWLWVRGVPVAGVPLQLNLLQCEYGYACQTRRALFRQCDRNHILPGE